MKHLNQPRISRQYSHWLLQFLVISLLCSLAVPLLDSALNNWPSWSSSLTGYLLGIIYSVCIGGILSPITPWVWKRTCRTPPLLRWVLRVLLILAGTAVGCLLAGVPVQAILGPRYHFWPSFKASFQIAMVLSAFVTVVLAAYGTFRAKLEVSQLQLKEKEIEREKALKLATEEAFGVLTISPL